MTATFSSIQSRVISKLIDVPTNVLNDVPALINDAYQKLQLEHNYKVMEVLLTPTTVLNQRLLTTIPIRFKEWRDKPYYINFTGFQIPMAWAPNVWAITGGFGTQDIGFPQILNIPEVTSTTGDLTGEIDVWPLPDGASDYPDGQYRVVIPYVTYLPDLSNAGDTNWLVDKGHLFIEADAISQGFYADWDEARGDHWAAIASQRKGEVLKRDKLYRLSGFKELVPHRDVYQPHLGV